MPDNLDDLIASKFIARPDVKAIQHTNGSWSPHTADGKRDGERLPWRRKDLNDHLDGRVTYGHYMLSKDDQVKLFAFDIDLNENQPDPNKPNPFQGYYTPLDDESGSIFEFNPREAWMNRAHPSRLGLKYDFKMLATTLMARITEELEIPCAAAYSGGKGIHVYGFTGLISAADAREGAAIVLESLGGWSPLRGDNFFRPDGWDDNSTLVPYRNLTIEVFPKQDSLAGKDLGNLMRLPLGRNHKNPKDPTFFIDMTSPMAQMAPIDPILALTESPWKLAYV